MKELMKQVGQEKFYSIDGLKVLVEIVDIKKVYGNVLCLIVPIAGNGQKWTRLDNLKELE